MLRSCRICAKWVCVSFLMAFCTILEIAVRACKNATEVSPALMFLTGWIIAAIASVSKIRSIQKIGVLA